MNKLLVIVLLFPIVLFAQEEKDSISYNQENSFFEDQRFVSASDFVFQTFEETTQLFKLNLLGAILNDYNLDYGDRYAPVNYLEFAYEKKIGKAFSVNGSALLFFSLSDIYTGFDSDYLRYGFEVGLQTRWYYNMRKRIAKGKSANNLSGNYFGLSTRLKRNWAQLDSSPTINNAQNFIGLKYGIQRRVFRRGFIDIQFGPEFQLNESQWNSGTWSFSSEIKLGIALGKPKMSMDAQQRCDVFQCFQERKRMLKIDLLNLIKITNNGFFSGDLYLGYEHKLGTLWSLNHELKLSYLSFKRFPDTNQFTLNLRLQTQLRYYYNLRKRIAQGKSANNLSANYFGIELRTHSFLRYAYIEGLGGRIEKNPLKVFFSPIWGIQRTIFKRGFIDFTVGLPLFLVDGDSRAYKSFRFIFYGPYSSLRIGLAF